MKQDNKFLAGTEFAIGILYLLADNDEDVEHFVKAIREGREHFQNEVSTAWSV